MFNLLPENLRKKIITEYRLRLTIMAFIFIIIVQVSFLIFLFPSWLTSYYREKEFAGRSDEINKFLATSDLSSTTSFIKSLNTKLNIINDNLDYPRLVPIVNEALLKRTPTIKLNEIYYNVTSAKGGELILKGIGSSRESLVSFTESLKKISFFKKVDLPISNLAKDKNIDFSINIIIEK
jgi:hypothetical protein